MSSKASAKNSTAFDSQEFLATLTDAPGVYRMLDADSAVLYVGKAKNLKKRVSSYFNKGGHSPRIALMLQQVAAMEVTATRSEAEALILENTLIKKLAPKYNILFRDDKSYPYIGLGGKDGGGEFPRLFYHRGAFEKKSHYFGPFPNGLAVRESIQLIQKTFLLRTCEESVFANRSRPCLMHQIKRCKAPCVGLISKEDYAADVRLAGMFLRGRHSEVIDGLTQQMEVAATGLHFEEAAALRDQIRSLQAVLHRQYVSSTKDADVDIIVAVVERSSLCVNLAMVRGGLHLGDRAYFPQAAAEAEAEEGLAAFVAQHYAEQPAPARLILSPWPVEDLPDGLNAGPPKNEMERAWVEMAMTNARLAVQARWQAKTRSSGRLASLQEALDLPEPPRRIECFDISHTLGEATVASCVVYDNCAMRNNEYRRYNIEGITPGDDYAAMREALSRRYQKVASGEGQLPDLILIDGGKGQVTAAQEALQELGISDANLLGVAKGEERKPGLEQLISPLSEKPLQLPSEHAALHLIQQIRDEAHRFAIQGHRGRRAKARTSSSRENIDGVGAKRRQRLLGRFGGLKGVLTASIEELQQTEGISRKLAEKIYRELH